MEQKRDSGLGVPLAKPRVALSAASPRADYRAVGFPLQSLTRNASLVRTLTVVILCLMLSAQNACGQTDQGDAAWSERADTSSIVILPYDPSDHSLFGEKCKNADLSVWDLNTIERLVQECIDGYMKGRDTIDPSAVSRIGYNLQLIAVINAQGEKEVWVNALCDRSKHDLRSNIVIVKDGGNCYYQLKLNLTKGSYYGFVINGST